MDALSLSSHLISLNTRLSKPPTFPLRPSTSPQSFNCSLSSHQLPKNHQTLAVVNNNPLYLSAQQAPPSPRRDGDVMGMLLRERIVFLGYEINDFVADCVISQLLLLDAQDSTKDIKLFINSPGGSFSATMALYDVVRLVRADVSTVAMGIAASTASIILGGGTKGKRYAMPNARIMMHQPTGGAGGAASDVEIQTRELMQNKASMIKIISDFTGRTLEEVEKDIDKDRYMSPIEAVEYGMIDGVIDRDSIIPLAPVPKDVMSSLYEPARDRTFLKADIPDDEIY